MPWIPEACLCNRYLQCRVHEKFGSKHPLISIGKNSNITHSGIFCFLTVLYRIPRIMRLPENEDISIPPWLCVIWLPPWVHTGSLNRDDPIGSTHLLSAKLNHEDPSAWQLKAWFLVFYDATPLSVIPLAHRCFPQENFQRWLFSETSKLLSSFTEDQQSSMWAKNLESRISTSGFTCLWTSQTTISGVISKTGFV